MKIKNKLAVILTSAIFGSALIAGMAAAAPGDTVDKAKRQEIRQQIEAIKKLPEAQRKAKFDELKKKYPEFANHKRGGKKGQFMAKKIAELEKSNPQLATELKNLKNLTKEQKRAEIEELKKKYPEFANWKNKRNKNNQ